MFEQKNERKEKRREDLGIICAVRLAAKGKLVVSALY